jgi:hypothetical protein
MSGHFTTAIATCKVQMALFRFLGLRKEVPDDGMSMSEREFSRLDVLSDLAVGRITVGDACDLLGLRRRQVFKLG